MLEMYSQCCCVMKMFDHCVARISLSWNDNVSSAYRINFVGERERGRKQRGFPPKNAIHLVQNLSLFKTEQVQSDTGENLGRPGSDVYQSTN